MPHKWIVLFAHADWLARRWLAKYYSPASSRRKTEWFLSVGILPQIKLLLGLLVIQLVWYLLKQLFTSVSVKVVDIIRHYSPPLRWIIVYEKNRSECVLEVWAYALFYSIRLESGSLIAISEKAISVKVKVLLWNWRNWNRVENLWPLACILEQKPNKWHGLARRVRLRANSAVLERPIDKIVLLEVPRLHESS